MRNARRFLVGMVGVTVVAVSGCGGGHHVPNVHPSALDIKIGGTGMTGMEPVAHGPVRVRGAMPGGTVRVLTRRGLRGSLDPTTAHARDVVSILSGLVTRSLTQYRYDPSTRTMWLVPDLATDLGQHNVDYTHWRFTIRGGARFEDWTRVTARDVVRGIDRCRRHRRSVGSPCHGVPFRSVSVPRPRTVDIRLTRAYPDLPYLATMPALGPVPPRRTGVDGRPPASGPYRISSYRRGQRLVLVRNTQWDPASDPGRTAYPARYVFRSGLSSRHIDRLLLADRGHARTTLTYDSMPPRRWLSSPTRSTRLVRGPSPCTTYLAPDNRVVTDPEVRRALRWAYPYRAMVRLQGLTVGLTARAASGAVPRRVLDWRGNVPHSTHLAFSTRPGVARRMLTAAHAVGTPVSFPWTPTRTGARERDVMLAALRRAGFAPTAVRAGSGPVSVRTRTWCGSWPTGDAWLVPLYQQGASADAEHFTSTYVDTRIRKTEHEPLDVLPEEWNRLDKLVLRRWSPIVPLWYSGVAMAHGRDVMGMHDDSVRGMPTWAGLWVAR